MKSIKEIRDRINEYRVENHYEPADLIAILEILSDLAEHVARIEGKAIWRQRGGGSIGLDGE